MSERITFIDASALRARVLGALRPMAPHTVHVWRTPMSAITPLTDEMRSLLSPDERTRAGEFRFPELRARFTSGRALLRMILGAYCTCAPEDLRFTYGDQQKPDIDREKSRLERTVSFNVSHSANALQLAISAEGALGIDVEDPERKFDLDGLVAECLTDEEERSLHRLSPARRRNAFIRYWVHKEAFLKCVGTGFSVSPKDVHVTFGDGGRSEMRCADPMASVVLFGRDLESEPGHLAAIATANRECSVESIVL